jgi:PEP-CTERM motif
MTLVVATAIMPWPTTARATPCTSLPTLMQTVELQPTNWNFPLLTIPKFDPINGNLCMVVVRLSASLEAQLHATNTAGVPASLTATMNVNANITAPAPMANFSATPIASMQTINVPAMGSTDFLAGPVPSSMTQTFNTVGDMNQFVGPGTLFFGASANGSFSFTTNTGNADLTGSTRAGAKIEVTYYVPEPGSLSLLGMGIVALVARRRSRQ